MSLYLCVDCGGSKTSAVICSSTGKVLGRALGGPSNFAYLGVDAFTDSVRVAVSNALKTCLTPASVEPVHLPPPTPLFAAAWFGISGVDSQNAIASATVALSQLLNIPPGPKLAVANDTHLLAAPIRMHPDVDHALAVIAGTGSISVSFARGPHGTLQELGRVGGWGWILGDEGGGFHVGREAIRQFMIDTDMSSVGGPSLPASVLKQRILDKFEVDSPMNLLSIIHLPDPSSAAAQPPDAPAHLLVAREKRLSQLSPLVFDAAFIDGDPFALRVLQVCSRELASQIRYLLHHPSSSHEPAPKSIHASSSVICFGGSLVGIEKYRNMVLSALKEHGHVFKYVEFVDDAAKVGARGLAAASAGV